MYKQLGLPKTLYLIEKDFEHSYEQPSTITHSFLQGFILIIVAVYQPQL